MTLPSPSSHTYLAGEDENRLASAAEYLGLEQARQPRFYRLLFSSDLTAARMHSVGVLGTDERVDASGTLHLVSLRKKEKELRSPSYSKLSDLFVPPGLDDAESHQEANLEIESNDVDTEVEEIAVVEGGSLQAAVFGIIKGTVGPAILYLPRGFQTAGYAVAIPAMVFATIMYIYNAHLLLECWKIESDKNRTLKVRLMEVQALLMDRRMTYGSAMTTPSDPYVPKLLTYPELARRSLGWFSVFVDLGIASMQFGVCLTYLIFVPQNLYESSKVLLTDTGILSHVIGKPYFLLAMILVEIPMSWIRDIRKLTPTNVLATILIAYGLCMVLIMAVVEGTTQSETSNELVFIENLQSLPAVNSDSWFLFVGTSFFMMEGSITLLIPLQEAVYLDEEKARFPKMNQVVTTWIVLFYVSFSLIGCAAFGDDIQTALTASLHGNRIAITSIQLAYSIAVILTFPLQAFPAVEVAFRMLGVNTKETSRTNISSTLLICALGVIAYYSIDYLGNVVSILGSLFGIPLALIFPPLMHNALSSKRRGVNNCVIAVGILAIGASSYATIVSWDKGAER